MRRGLHWLYYIVVAFKSVDAFLETASSILFFIKSATALRRAVDKLSGSILDHDPDNAIAQAMRHAFDHLSHRQRVLAALFLLGHGVVKSVLVIGLWMRWRWAFILAIIALIGFALYEFWSWLHGHSLAIGVIAAIDLAAALLIWVEYRSRWKHPHASR